MGDLDKKVAVVSGGTRGIGLAIATALLSEGAQVFAGSRSVVSGEQPAHANSSLSEAVAQRLTCLPLDVSCAASVERFILTVSERAGPPAILVNSAGISHHQDVIGHDDAAWQQVLDVNLTGTYLMTKACMPLMKQRGWGRIINIASTAAHTAHPGYAAYCASKAGVLGLTRTVALEGAPYGVNCVSVSPTWVATDMLQATAAETAANEGIDKSTVLDKIAQANPQGRIVEPDEIAALVALLCSDSISGLTMEDIQINAGAHW